MIIVIMGVSGSGKTTIGENLAEFLGWEFADADDFHPQENIEKMKAGFPLNDTDRWPWLQKIQDEIKRNLQENTDLVLTCSALKASYREMLLVNEESVKLVYLKGSFELIEERLKARENHFMKAGLLQSQFDTLEEPTDAIVIDISQSVEDIVQEIVKSISSDLG